MSDTLSILRALLAEVDAGRLAALCAVLRTRGSTPQRPGATMLVRADSGTLGTLGGGGIEAEARRRAFDLLGAGASASLEFELDHDHGGEDTLICGGRMMIGVNVVAPASDLTPYRRAVADAERREPAWFPLTVTHEGPPVTYRIHLEITPVLLIAGAGHVGHAVAKLAVELGFHVIVVDDRADVASVERFPLPIERRIGDIPSVLREYSVNANTFVVIVTRGHEHDRQALEAVIGRPACYIGMMGSHRKARAVLDGLRAAGVPAEQIDQVHSPIGVPIGSVTVPEIAVSIVAELVQHRRRETQPLVSGPEGSDVS
ncbi:MAG: XdhC family protein [Phycisphaerae bacterium]|nr:XdhC family protein [Phycisphaerae bacterium]